MITKETYGPQAMKRATNGLPRGTRQHLSAKLNIPYTTICNIWSGKTWDEKVVRNIERLKQKQLA
jgi:hypothetical protein